MLRALRLVSSNEGQEIQPIDDGEILAKIAAGDVGAMTALYKRHAGAVLSFARRVVGANDADDILQSTFVRAATSASSFDRRTPSARKWLIGISARLVQERRRSFVRLARALVRFASSEGDYQTLTEAEDLRRALDKISEPKRLVLILVEVEGYTGDEVAAMLDVPIGTVWTRLHYGRRELRALYQEDGHGR